MFSPIRMLSRVSAHSPPSPSTNSCTFTSGPATYRTASQSTTAFRSNDIKPIQCTGACLMARPALRRPAVCGGHTLRTPRQPGSCRSAPAACRPSRRQKCCRPGRMRHDERSREGHAKTSMQSIHLRSMLTAQLAPMMLEPSSGSNETCNARTRPASGLRCMPRERNAFSVLLSALWVYRVAGAAQALHAGGLLRAGARDGAACSQCVKHDAVGGHVRLHVSDSGL